MSFDLNIEQIDPINIDYDNLNVNSIYYYQPEISTQKFRQVKLVSKSRSETKRLYEEQKTENLKNLNSNDQEIQQRAVAINNFPDYVNNPINGSEMNENGVGLLFVEDGNMIFINKSDNPVLYNPKSGGKKNRKSKRNKSKRNKSKRRRSSTRRKK